MSGVSTRSHRSSVRGVETTLTELSDLLKANKSIVMITGAGLSAASGGLDFRIRYTPYFCSYIVVVDLHHPKVAVKSMRGAFCGRLDGLSRGEVSCGGSARVQPRVVRMDYSSRCI